MNTKMFTVRVETMPGLKLGFRAEWDVGINKNTGAVIVEEWDKPLLHKFHLQQNGTYREEWRRQWLEDVKDHSHKYLMDSGSFILQNKDGTTFVFDQEMKLIDSWQHQGYLIATLPGTRTVYAVREGEECHVEIRIKEGEVLQLKPEGSPWQNSDLSVCEDATIGKLVVAYASDQLQNGNLDIFSRDGKTKQRIYSMTHVLSINVFVCDFRPQ